MAIRINGVIVSDRDKWIYDWFGEPSFCPNDLLEDLESGKDIDIQINSPGGSVFAGSEIYTLLMNHKGNVNITITGLCASIASVIAMAGTTVSMSPTAQFMIHNVSGMTSGDYRDMEHMAEVLKKNNEALCNAYEIKSGLSRDEILEMMNHETWLTAQECLDKGFIDNIKSKEEKEPVQLVAGYKPNIIPQSILDKMNLSKEKEKLNLLKLKELK